MMLISSAAKTATKSIYNLVKYLLQQNVFLQNTERKYLDEDDNYSRDMHNLTQKVAELAQFEDEVTVLHKGSESFVTLTDHNSVFKKDYGINIKDAYSLEKEELLQTSIFTSLCRSYFKRVENKPRIKKAFLKSELNIDNLSKQDRKNYNYKLVANLVKLVMLLSRSIDEEQLRVVETAGKIIVLILQ